MPSCRAAIPFAVLGKGSNVLVADEGFPGLVLRLGRGFRWTARAGDVVQAGGAMPLPALAGVALHHGLAGLAFAVAIPASLGGAVRMNAGAHGGQMSDVVEAVELFDLRGGGQTSRGSADVGFGYRHTDLGSESVVIGASLRLHPDDPAVIRSAMDDARRWRRETQPIAEPNCGSVFTNPPGAHAAALIEAAGLKGARVGGAQRVSEARQLHRDGARRHRRRRRGADPDDPGPYRGGHRDPAGAGGPRDRRRPMTDHTARRRRLVALIIGAAALVALAGWALTYTSIFHAHHIRVQGAGVLTAEEVRTLAGVSEGTNVVHFDRQGTVDRPRGQPVDRGCERARRSCPTPSSSA